MGSNNVRYASPNKEQDKVTDGLLKLREPYSPVETRGCFTTRGTLKSLLLGPQGVSSSYIPMQWARVELYYDSGSSGDNYGFAKSGHYPSSDEWKIIDGAGKVITASRGANQKHIWDGEVKIREVATIDTLTEMAYRRTLVYT